MTNRMKSRKTEPEFQVPPNTLLIEMNGTVVNSFPALFQAYKELLLNAVKKSSNINKVFITLEL